MLFAVHAIDVEATPQGRVKREGTLLSLRIHLLPP
jgi:hypothetical protein